MFLVQVFRPEARGNYDGRTESYEAWEKDPFEGIEVLGICGTEEEVNALIDEYKPGNPRWRFHYEEIQIPSTEAVLWIAAIDQVPIEDRSLWVKTMLARIEQINAERLALGVGEI